MISFKDLPKCEATKAGIVPPTDIDQFDTWRRSLDPDAMGFDGMEAGDLNESDN